MENNIRNSFEKEEKFTDLRIIRYCQKSSLQVKQKFLKFDIVILIIMKTMLSYKRFTLKII